MLIKNEQTERGSHLTCSSIPESTMSNKIIMYYVASNRNVEHIMTYDSKLNRN